MKVILAEKAGFCFGVNRAVTLALNTKKQFPNKKIFTLGPLIHNADAVKYLKEHDIYPIELNEIDSLKKGDIIIIRSHGVSEKIIETLNDKELKIINATCPFVLNIQQKAKKYHDSGYKIILLGDANHAEMIGVNGWCDNSALITTNPKHLLNIKGKVCLLSQTTEKKENFDNLFQILKNNLDIELIYFNTICDATSERQHSAEKLSKEVDLMVVLGGKNSSNTNKLYQICKKNCENTILAENISEVHNIINKDYNKLNLIGVTAGASTPDWIIEEAIKEMSEDKIINEQELLMNELENNKLSIGDVVNGEIVLLYASEAYVNIGYKTEALLPIGECGKPNEEILNLKELFKVGDVIKGKILNLGSQPIISIKELYRKELELLKKNGLQELQNAFNENLTLTIKVTKVINGGLECDYKNNRVFLPSSRIELHHIDNLDDYVGKDLEVNIIEFKLDRYKSKIVASRKEILTKLKEKQEELVISNLNAGDVIEGEVKRIEPYGAFVDINGIDGLLHISEVSYSKVAKISDEVKIGEKKNFYILSVDKDTKKISLSLKALLPNPWNNVAEKYPEGAIVLGKVVNFVTFGAFIELESGIQGLVHLSQISNKRILKADSVLTLGEMVKAKIISVNEETKRIELSIKDLDEL